MSRRVDIIVHTARGGSSKTLFDQLEEIRHLAIGYDMTVLAGLVGQLERALADTPGHVTISSFVGAFYDAIGCDNADPSIAAALYGSVGSRLHG